MIKMYIVNPRNNHLKKVKLISQYRDKWNNKTFD